MKMLIRQRVFSWADSFDIYDEYEQRIYTCRGEMFSLGHKLHVTDTHGQEVGYLEQELFHFLPVFNVYMHGSFVGKVNRKFSFFMPEYEMDYQGWRVEGDCMSWNYTVYDHNGIVLQIHKELLSWGDTYVIEYDRKEDELQGLMLVLAIDAANCKNN